MVLKDCTNTMKENKRLALMPLNSQSLGISRTSSFKKIKKDVESFVDKENIRPF